MTPKVLVDLGGIPELKGIQAASDGLTIGAMTTLTEVARHAAVRERYRVLADAARVVASPQIRNQGTIGGNVSQMTRCWYYRGGWQCYRAGGHTCYADTPTALNREHGIYDATRCMAVNPSDTAPALIALDATMTIRSSAGERVVAADDYFIGPATDITRMTVLEPGDLLTSIHVPATWAGARFYFEKARDRKSWDFALVNVAAALRVSDGVIRDARIVVNGVAARPQASAGGGSRRPRQAAHRGDGHARRRARRARARHPLRYNAYKVLLMRNLVKRAIRGVEGSWTS